MANSVIHQSPIKYVLKENISAVFNNSNTSTGWTLSDLTGGVVTPSNFVAVLGTGVGGAMTPYVDSLRKVYMRYSQNLNGSYDTSIIIYYR